MKNLSNWLNANKISLNVKKRETIICKSRRKKYEGVIKLILDKWRLYPSNNIKYLGFKIDENLNWKHHVNDTWTKLIRGSAILFKIRNYVNPEMLRSIYFVIFECHLNCSFLAWAQNFDCIKHLIILQKKVLRIINFKLRNCHTSLLFKENAILKLMDKVNLEHILIVNESINILLKQIFNDGSAQHNYQTSGSTKEKLFKPFHTISYGKNVISSSIQSWNNAQQKLGSLKLFFCKNWTINYRCNSKKSLTIVFNYDILMH